MSLRSIPTLTVDGAPLNIEIVTRQAVEFSNPAVTLQSITDDGSSITAIITFANGQNQNITLYTGYTYQPIADLTDEVIDARIVLIVTAMSDPD